MPDYTVRQMRPEEMSLAVSWAAAEGWNPGLHDGDAFYGTDPTGFFIGELDGEPVTCLSAVAYDEGFGFLGFYIVKPEHRGKGYGWEIWQRATAYLGQRNVGLDAVVEQQATYERSGFVRAYRSVRYAGVPPEAAAAHHPDVVPIAEVPFEDVLRYDTAMFPVERRGFLERWLALPDSTGLALRRDGALAGFGVVRRCHEGFKVGPLFADDAAGAEQLFLALASHAEAGAPLYLDAPEPNAAAVRLAEAYDMTPSFETVRMYSRGEPSVALDRLFGVTSFELG